MCLRLARQRPRTWGSGQPPWRRQRQQAWPSMQYSWLSTSQLSRWVRAALPTALRHGTTWHVALGSCHGRMHDYTGRAPAPFKWHVLGGRPAAEDPARSTFFDPTTWPVGSPRRLRRSAFHALLSMRHCNGLFACLSWVVIRCVVVVRYCAWGTSARPQLRPRPQALAVAVAPVPTLRQRPLPSWASSGPWC